MKNSNNHDRRHIYYQLQIMGYLVLIAMLAGTIITVASSAG